MKRSPLLVVGLVIAVLGGVGLALGGFTTEDQQTVLEIGSFEATATVEERVEIPPLLSGVVLALGVGLVVYGATKKS